MNKNLRNCREKILNHLEFIYPDIDAEELADKLIGLMGLDKKCKKVKPYKNHWDQQDVIAITYADTFIRKGEKPLHTLHQFF